MSDTLIIYGTEFDNVNGIKAKDNNGETLTYIRGIDGNDLAYGLTAAATSPRIGVGQIDYMEVE